MSKGQNQDTKEVDVIVVGAGAAGLTAATVAAKQGLKVLLVEKAEFFGGTTSYSGGGLWVPLNPAQERVGVKDDRAKIETYLKNVLKEYYDPELIDAFLKSGGEMVNYLETKASLKFWTYPQFSDYFPDEPGAGFGRSILAAPFDGSILGRKYLSQVRLPILGYYAIFGTMQVDGSLDGPVFVKATTSIKALLYTAGRFFKYLWHLVRFGKGAYLAHGNALIGMLLKSAIDAKVELWRCSPLLSLIKEGDKVTGAIVEHNGDPVRVTARKGVVIATGGFGGNSLLRAKYYLEPDAHVNANPKEVVGDGVLAAVAAGAAIGPQNPDQAVWAPTSTMKFKDGTYRRYPHFGTDRGKPGIIIVDLNGKRFVDEAEPYVTFVHKMKVQKIGKAFMIADRKGRAKYGLGFALPFPYPDLGFSSSGYLISAPTLRELAKKLGVDEAGLTETVKNYNLHAKDGRDPEFHKGENNYDIVQGDPENKPNPNVRGLEKGPFYAVELQQGDVGSAVGIKANKYAQALDENDNVVKGLYVVGSDTHNLFRGFYPGGGSGIGPGMTFGYRAALHLAGKEELL